MQPPTVREVIERGEEMSYVYGGQIEKVDGSFLASIPAFPGCFGGGDTIADACRNASEALRLFIAEYLDGGTPLPPQIISTEPSVVFSVDVTDEFLASSKCMTVSDAAEALGISPGRVSQLLDSGGLEAYQHGGTRMVTIASVNARKNNKPAPHRPKQKTIV